MSTIPTQSPPPQAGYFHPPRRCYRKNQPSREILSLVRSFEPKTPASIDKFYHEIETNPAKFSKKVQKVLKKLKEAHIIFSHGYKTTVCKSINKIEDCTYGRNCLYAHALVTYVAFNTLAHPDFKQNLCEKNPCKFEPRGKCRDIHDRDVFCVIGRDGQMRWNIYEEASATSPVSSTVVDDSGTDSTSPSPSLADSFERDVEAMIQEATNYYARYTEEQEVEQREVEQLLRRATLAYRAPVANL
jgi:hypothetical protein